jgi:TatA/E family protein of Tat protein translocase
MPFNIGPFELLLVLILALLVLGPGKLPEVGRALGRTIGEFRHASSNLEEAMRVDPTPARPVAPPAAPAADSAPDVREDRAAT